MPDDWNFKVTVITGGQPPTSTVNSPFKIMPPQATLSPMRAAGFLPIKTDVEPFKIGCGKAGLHMSSIRAAGSLPTRTVGQHGGMIGTGTGTGTGGAGGGPGVKQACRSRILACGIPGI